MSDLYSVLIQQEKEALKKLEDIRHKIRDEVERINLEKHGFNVGDLVADSEGVVFKLSGFDGYWLTGNRKTKHGFHNQSRTIHNEPITKLEDVQA